MKRDPFAEAAKAYAVSRQYQDDRNKPAPLAPFIAVGMICAMLPWLPLAFLCGGFNDSER